MEKEVKERMQLIIKQFETNCTQLANRYNVNQKTLSSQVNQETAVSLSTILLILDAFPEVSAEWLLRGEGEMIKKHEEIISTSDAELVALSRELVGVIGKIMNFNK